MLHASDRRLKENIHTIETRDAYERVRRLQIVEYDIRPEVADEWGLSEQERRKVGVIAQDLDEVLPDAVIKVRRSSLNIEDKFNNFTGWRIFTSGRQSHILRSCRCRKGYDECY